MRDVCTYMAGNCCISFFSLSALSPIHIFPKKHGLLSVSYTPKMCTIHRPKFFRAVTISTGGTYSY
jgi:hypothetical protein